ncbi:hypothetical protein ACJX0J_029268 [Zea mays]
MGVLGLYEIIKKCVPFMNRDLVAEKQDPENTGLFDATSESLHFIWFDVIQKSVPGGYITIQVDFDQTLQTLLPSMKLSNVSLKKIKQTHDKLLKIQKNIFQNVIFSLGNMIVFRYNLTARNALYFFLFIILKVSLDIYKPYIIKEVHFFIYFLLSTICIINYIVNFVISYFSTYLIMTYLLISLDYYTYWVSLHARFN